MIYPPKDIEIRQFVEDTNFVVKAIVYLLESSLNIDSSCSPLSSLVNKEINVIMDRIIARIIGYSSKRIYHHISQTEYWRTQTLRYIFSEDKSLSNIIYIRFFVFYELSVVQFFILHIMWIIYLYN